MSIQWFSEHYRWLFVPLGLFHLMLFVSLQAQLKRRLAMLRAFVRNLASRVVQPWSEERPESTVAEEIDLLLHDLKDAAAAGAWDPERSSRIRDAVFAADAPHKYLYDRSFEKRLSLAKAIIEIYPLLGIVGTVLAIAAGMAPLDAREPHVRPAIVAASPAPGSAAIAPRLDEDSSGENELRNVTQNFGHSVWTTLIGLSLAIVFLLLSSWWEPEFQQLIEYRRGIADILHNVKSRLGGPIRPVAAAPRPESVGPLRRRATDEKA